MKKDPDLVRNCSAELVSYKKKKRIQFEAIGSATFYFKLCKSVKATKTFHDSSNQKKEGQMLHLFITKKVKQILRQKQILIGYQNNDLQILIVLQIVNFMWILVKI
eukprot:TRINITY_DN15694_c0_g1_i1.p4 TRINITY_DN15694_c0_g1~~TRINITY_DN15694_c0_g1_i1.p4  ORF type:complete len:106 (+),score=3.41 TRINITY_DN15694_c0_g1_i1:725-1042(+)